MATFDVEDIRGFIAESEARKDRGQPKISQEGNITRLTLPGSRSWPTTGELTPAAKAVLDEYAAKNKIQIQHIEPSAPLSEAERARRDAVIAESNKVDTAGLNEMLGGMGGRTPIITHLHDQVYNIRDPNERGMGSTVELTDNAERDLKNSGRPIIEKTAGPTVDAKTAFKNYVAELRAPLDQVDAKWEGQPLSPAQDAQYRSERENAVVLTTAQVEKLVDLAEAAHQQDPNFLPVVNAGADDNRVGFRVPQQEGFTINFADAGAKQALMDAPSGVILNSINTEQRRPTGPLRPRDQETPAEPAVRSPLRARQPINYVPEEGAGHQDVDVRPVGYERPNYQKGVDV